MLIFQQKLPHNNKITEKGQKSPFLFETIRVVNGKTPLLAHHVERLAYTAKKLNYPLPDFQKIEQELQQIQKKEARVRITLLNGFVFGEVFDFIPQNVPYIEVEAIPFERKQAEMKYRTKVYTYFIQKREKEIFESLLINNKGNITEGSFTNVFFRFGSRFVVPNNALPGVMSKIVVQYLQKTGILVEKKDVSVQEAKKADEIWLTNALRGIMFVKKWENWSPTEMVMPEIKGDALFCLAD